MNSAPNYDASSQLGREPFPTALLQQLREEGHLSSEQLATIQAGNMSTFIADINSGDGGADSDTDTDEEMEELFRTAMLMEEGKSVASIIEKAKSRVREERGGGAGAGRAANGPLCRCRKPLRTLSSRTVAATGSAPSCNSCRLRIAHGTPGYACRECMHAFCDQCVREKRHTIVNKWPHTGLFDCAQDLGAFAACVLCPHCFLAKMANFNGYTAPPSLHDPHPGIRPGCTCEEAPLCIKYALCDLFTLSLCSCCVVMQQRDAIAQEYHLQNESAVACKALFCRCCLATATHREMTARGHFPGGILWARRPKQSLQRLRPPCPPTQLA